MDKTSKIVVQKGIGNEHRAALAEIFYDAFGRKLQPALGKRETALQILQEDIKPENVVVALDESGEILGLVVLKHKGSPPFFDLRFSTLKKHYGFFGAVYRVLVALILHTPEIANDKELMIESIAVAPKSRGLGIGTTLLNYVKELGRTAGYKIIKLQVIDVNVAARKLYEREGYEVTKKHYFGIFTKGMGFTSAETMELRLD